MIVIGLLRFLGLVNAAAWLGAMIFLLFVASPASHSPEMGQLLGPRNSPFFSEAINQLMTARFFTLFLVCSLLGFLHMGAERLYLGKQPKRFWLVLLFALALGGVAQLYGIQPMLRHRWLVSHSPGTKVEQREKAARSFRI